MSRDGTSPAPPGRGPREDGTSPAPPGRGPREDGTSPAPPGRGPRETEASLDATLLWLCAIPSPIGEEQALCDAVEARLSRLALPAPIRRYLNSIVVPLKRGSGGPHVVLAGHLDTVRTENGPARIEEGRCHGAGASDMKSGLAVMIELAERLELPALGCDLTLVFYSKEEGPFAENELGPVLEQDAELASTDLAVCLEPSDNRLHLGCVGSMHATVTFRGKTAHSARPWQGENAITKSAPFLAEMAALGREDETIDGLVYSTVATVTHARDGDRGRNVVPDSFALNLNLRFSPSISLEQAEARVRALVRERAEIDFTDKSPSALPNAGHPLVRALVASGVRGVEPKQAWTDVARFSARGIVAVNFGPGENKEAHQRNESTSLALVHEGYAILTRWLGRLGQQA